MPNRRKFKPNLVGLGQIFRLLVVALMLMTGVAALPGQAAAKVNPFSGIYAQGASWETHPQSQKNNDDDEEEDDSSSGKNTKNNKDDDEEDDSSSGSSKNNQDDEEDDSSSGSSKNNQDDEEDDSSGGSSKNNQDDDEEDDSSSGSSNNNDDEELPRQWTRDGVVSATEYESPQYGYAVEWADPWVIDDFYDTDDDDTTATVVSDEDTGLDEIRLWSPDAGGLLTVQFTPTNDSDASDVQDYWESDEYYEGFTGGGEYLASDGDSDRAGVLFLIGDAEDGYIGYNEVTIADDGETLIALYLRAPIAEFLDVYGDGGDNITVDGEEIFDILSSRDVRNAIRDL